MKVLRVGDAFAGGRGNGVAQVAFAAQPEAGHAGAVLDKQCGVQRARHGGHVLDVMRVNDRGVLVIVFGRQRRFDALLDALDPHDWQERHHLLFLNKRMVLVGFGKEQLGLVGHIRRRPP